MVLAVESVSMVTVMTLPSTLISGVPDGWLVEAVT